VGGADAEGISAIFSREKIALNPKSKFQMSNKWPMTNTKFDLLDFELDLKFSL
jgi:hypothetical protein